MSETDESQEEQFNRRALMRMFMMASEDTTDVEGILLLNPQDPRYPLLYEISGRPQMIHVPINGMRPVPGAQHKTAALTEAFLAHPKVDAAIKLALKGEITMGKERCTVRKKHDQSKAATLGLALLPRNADEARRFTGCVLKPLPYQLIPEAILEDGSVVQRGGYLTQRLNITLTIKDPEGSDGETSVQLNGVVYISTVFNPLYDEISHNYVANDEHAAYGIFLHDTLVQGIQNNLHEMAALNRIDDQPFQSEHTLVTCKVIRAYEAFVGTILPQIGPKWDKTIDEFGKLDPAFRAERKLLPYATTQIEYWQSQGRTPKPNHRALAARLTRLVLSETTNRRTGKNVMFFYAHHLLRDPLHKLVEAYFPNKESFITGYVTDKEPLTQAWDELTTVLFNAISDRMSEYLQDVGNQPLTNYTLKSLTGLTNRAHEP